ncbi:MAG TPA: hypothetical protein VLT51_12325 [Anaerolineales bacterium]|nr:hypothetical protein [Anaerolineales bacterium]
MTKKVTFNGIELTLPKYDEISQTIFDYLDNVITDLEKGLDKNDGIFQMSINVDFAADKLPKHKIYANGTTKKRTKAKVAKILKSTAEQQFDHVAGSVKVNLMVGDR